ncbi:Bicaudal d-related protein [Plakobranchus ocellatus]|uniref:Bicaudal d-related protein n=1 Tax=Plakobranchus ocellatus TaxID=259542 RepID=A0AAV3ZIT4_9GAST|nr:Bicaudal d-related protein [Plakobranchus ocellatus]
MASYPSSPHTNGSDPAGEQHILDFDASGSAGQHTEDGDVYQRLAQKERDLILAAELGKALLDSNQELQAQYDQTVEEYSLKVEELQQEKHGLHLELEKMEREYQNAIKDLQDDVASLQKQIQDGAEQQVVEKESSRFLREAQRNIDYLMEQIKKATLKEEELTAELNEERKKNKSSSATVQDQLDHIAMLREQVEYLGEKLKETNEKLEEIQNERDSLCCALEKAQEMLQLSEAKISQQNDKLHRQENQLEELQESNCELQQQINHLQSNQHLKQQNIFRAPESLRHHHLPRYNTHDGSISIRGSRNGQPRSVNRELSIQGIDSSSKVSQNTAQKDQKTIFQKKPKSLSLDMPHKFSMKEPASDRVLDFVKQEEQKPVAAIYHITQSDLQEILPLDDRTHHTSYACDNSVSSEDSHEQYHDTLSNRGSPAEQSLFAELCSSLSEEKTRESHSGLLKPSHCRNASDCSLSSLTEGSRKRQHDNIRTDSDDSDEDSSDRSGCKQILYSQGRDQHRLSHNSSFDNDAGISDIQSSSQWDNCPIALSSNDKVSEFNDGLNTGSLCASNGEELDPITLQHISNVKIGSPCQHDANKELSCGPRMRDLTQFTELSPVSELPPSQQEELPEQSLFSELSYQLGEDKAGSGSETSPGCAMGVFDFSTGFNSLPPEGEMHSTESVSDMLESGPRMESDMLNSGEWNQATSLTCDMLEEDDFECDDDDFLVGNMEGTTLSIGGGGHSLMYYSPNLYPDPRCKTNIEPEFFSFDKEDDEVDQHTGRESVTLNKPSLQDAEEQQKITEACKQLRELVVKAHANGLISSPKADIRDSSTDTLLALIGQLRLCVESACGDKVSQNKVFCEMTSLGQK